MPTICIPTPSGVPGLSGPPGFISDPAGATFKDKLDDPRWTGALGQGFPLVAGTPSQVAFRAVYANDGGKSLYLSWQVKADDAVHTGATGDVFYIGLSPGSGGAGPTMVFKFVLFGNATNDYANKPINDASVGGSIAAFTHPFSSTGTPDPSQPSWLNANTRVWRQGKQDTSVPFEYAIQMKVPYSFFNLGDTFRMWYAVRVKLNSQLVYHTWPANQEPSGLNGPFPDPATSWQEYGASPACAVGAGVGLFDYEDIGTLNTSTHAISLTKPNKFYACPTNSTGADIVALTINARFRIANWGSTATSDSWANVPGLEKVTHASPYPSGHPTPHATPTTQATPITGNWGLDSAQQTKYAPPNDHQCIFVTLSGAGVTFTKDSAARNMDFVPASLIEREAEINLLGLVPIAPQPRDVYILVKKGNMPKTAPANYNEGEFLSTTLNRLIEANPNNGQFVERLQAVMRQLDGGSGQAEEQAAQQLNELMSVLYAQLAQFPTKDGNEGNVLNPEQLVEGMSVWLAGVKQNKTASRNLAAFLGAFREWLADAKGAEDPKTRTFATALIAWVAQLPGDEASQKYLPDVIERLRNWLSNLYDPTGIADRLLEVIAAFGGWFQDRGSLDALIKLAKVLGLLSAWLGSLGNDEGNANAQVGFRALIADIREWLSPGKDRLGVLVGAMQQSGFTSEEYAKVFPTCVYHVFHDTGRRERRADGTMIPILAAQSGFGLHAYHEGALEGWSAIIEGATRLAEDFYVLKVPENGTARITTKIQAREPGEEPIKEPPIVVPPTDPPDPNDENFLEGCLRKLLKLLMGKK